MMKALAVLFLAACAVLLAACASSDVGTPGGFAEPNIMETQSRIQQMHSSAVRQEF